MAGDGANNGDFADFASQRLLQVGDVGIAGFKVLVDMDGELGNLARSSELRAAAPVAIAAECIHVGQNPGGNDEIGLFAGLAQQVQPYRNSIIFKTNKQIFSESDGLWIRGRIRPSGDGFNKRGCNGRGKLPPRQKETKSSLFNPRAGIFQGKSSKAVLAHSFGARLY